MKSTEIRKKFFEFFIKNSHTKVSSSSLIPAEDPTLLFTNAGMNQFKDVFLGKEKRSYSKATSIQKCVRAGGKHNDLDNVGFTTRHLTFFEMMGNFSFGDYFKREAIQFAWEFLTVEMGLPKEKLHATVFRDDDEAYDIWRKEIGLPKDKVHRLNEKDNFWQMGDTGPCGPCSEILLDRGESFGIADPEENGERFLEIWNLVFMQFNRQQDGTDIPLKQTGVDTGMGFERLCTIKQNTESVYETDIFTEIIEKTEKLTGRKYNENNLIKAAFRVLADHTRSTSLIISDGGLPSNEGRGYVLRKIIRRAALFARKLTNKNIIPDLAKTFIDSMSSVYPELKKHEKLILSILNDEVEKFAINLVRGQGILEKYFDENKNKKVVSGKQAFKLYDTYGFPSELIGVLAKENGFSVDFDGFEKEMQKQREQSKVVEKDEDDITVKLVDKISEEFKFTGYEEQLTKTTITSLIKENKLVDTIKAGETCWVITKKSPCYVEGGGQVGDVAWFEIDKTKVEIKKLKKIDGIVAAKIKTSSNIHVGTAVTVHVCSENRKATMRNHTATHLLQAALQQTFGSQVKQSGSFVTPEHLRFDFTYHKNVTSEEIENIENIVNEAILENIETSIYNTTFKEAKEKGALAFFGDKYNPENVRVVEIPGVSAELCGGTHVESTGTIGSFKITEINSLAAGHRRIVAETGMNAIKTFQQSFGTIKQICQDYKIQPHQATETISHQKEQLRESQLQIKKLKQELWQTKVPQLIEKSKTICDIPFILFETKNMANEDLRNLASGLEKQKAGFYFLISKNKDKTSFLAIIDRSLKEKINLRKLSQWLKESHSLSGGGPETMIQGGGEKIPSSLESKLIEWIENNAKL